MDAAFAGVPSPMFYGGSGGGSRRPKSPPHGWELGRRRKLTTGSPAVLLRGSRYPQRPNAPPS